MPLVWPNDDNFERPLDANGAPSPFVMVDIRWNGGDFMTIGAPGNNIARREGHIWLFAFTAQGIGQERAHELAAEAASIFEGQDFSGVVCAAMEPGGEADVEDGAYFGQSAAVPFDYDETA